jgi:hypothetical protein
METTTTTCKQEMTTTPQQHTTTTTQKFTTTTGKHNDGKCPYDQLKDGYGCCPRFINDQWFYRDGRGCYPMVSHKGVYYADANGCYPDDNGAYVQAGESCPADRQCKSACDGSY